MLLCLSLVYLQASGALQQAVDRLTPAQDAFPPSSPPAAASLPATPAEALLADTGHCEASSGVAQELAAPPLSTTRGNAFFSSSQTYIRQFLGLVPASEVAPLSSAAAGGVAAGDTGVAAGDTGDTGDTGVAGGDTGGDTGVAGGDTGGDTGAAAVVAAAVAAGDTGVTGGVTGGDTGVTGGVTGGVSGGVTGGVSGGAGSDSLTTWVRGEGEPRPAAAAAVADQDEQSAGGGVTRTRREELRGAAAALEEVATSASASASAGATDSDTNAGTISASDIVTDANTTSVGDSDAGTDAAIDGNSSGRGSSGSGGSSSSSSSLHHSQGAGVSTVNGEQTSGLDIKRDTGGNAGDRGRQQSTAGMSVHVDVARDYFTPYGRVSALSALQAVEVYWEQKCLGYCHHI
jgi:hypothetical protein